MASEWTIDTLMQHLLSLRESDLRAVDTLFIASREAITKADAANEKRFDNTNEWRASFADLQTKFITRVEVDALMSKRQSGDFSLIAAVSSVAAIIGALLGHFWK
jgi:hypothetical protein